jgi:hypothetical protein
MPRPIRIYLDTSDYSLMYCAAPGTSVAQIREKLRELVLNNAIEVGFSYQIVFELLQKAAPKYRGDRIARVRFLKELCGTNAFPANDDLGKGRHFSHNGIWFPEDFLETMRADEIAPRVMQQILSDLRLHRNDRRLLSKPKTFAKWIRSDPARLNLFAACVLRLPFPPELAASGDLLRYLAGEITLAEANFRLRSYYGDPETIYRMWFDRYDRENPVALLRDDLSERLLVMFRQSRKMLDDPLADLKKRIKALSEIAATREEREQVRELRARVNQFTAEIHSPEWVLQRSPGFLNSFGSESAMVAAGALVGLYLEQRELQRSDAIDLLHATYLPHTDLWRGDRGFSHLLLKYKVKYNERVVSTLDSLVPRIEDELAKHRESWVE